MSINKLVEDSNIPRKYSFVSPANKAIYSPFPSLSLSSGLYNIASAGIIKSPGSSGIGNPRLLINEDEYFNGADIVFPTGIQSLRTTFEGVRWATTALTATATDIVNGVAGISNVWAASTVLGVGTGIYTSTNGTTWTAATTTGSLLGIKASNGMFFAYSGTGSTLSHMSSNGVTWLNTTQSANGGVYGGAAYNPDTNRAIFVNNNLARVNQYNGTAWTTNVTSNTDYGISNSLDVEYGNGKYIMVGDNGRLAMSTDGLIWTRPGQMFSSGYSWSSTIRPITTSIKYNSGLYLQAGYMSNSSGNAYLNKSVDGINWQTFVPSLSNPNAAAALAYDPQDGYIVAGGSFTVSSTTSSVYIATSPDTITWTVPWGNAAPQYNKMVFGNGIYLGFLSGGGTLPIYSFGNQYANLLNTSPTANTSDVAYANGIFYGVGTNQSGRVSTNGTTWNSQSVSFPSSTDDASAIAYVNDRWIVGSAGSTLSISTSPTASTWVNTGLTTNIGVINAIAYGNGVYVLGGSTTPHITVSTNGTNWINHYVPTAISFVAGTTANFGAATSGSITLPTSATGDVMIVAISSTGALPAVPAGWTSAAAPGASGSDFLRVIYKVMGATPDTSVTITNLLTSSTAVAQAYRNVNTTTPLDVAATTNSITTASTSVAFVASGLPATSQTMTIGVIGIKAAATITNAFFTGINQIAGTAQATAMGYNLSLSSPVSVTPTAATASVSGTYATANITLRPANAVAVSVGTNPGNLTKIVFANNIFVAGISNTGATNGAGLIRTSTNGYVWTDAGNQTAFGSASGADVFGIAYGNGVWVAVGSGGNGQAIIAYATNPAGAWTSANTSAFSNINLVGPMNDVIFDGTYFIATTGAYLSTDYINNNHNVVISTDGINWVYGNAIGRISTSATPPKLSIANGKAFLSYPGVQNGLIVSGNLTADYSIWRQTFWSTNIQANSVVYGNNKYVTWGSNSNIYYSTDLISWTANNTNPNTSAMIFDGTSFVSYTSGTVRVRTSTDAIVWTTAVTTTKSGTPQAAAYGNSAYVVALGTEILRSSSVGGTYSTTYTSSNIEDLTFDGTKFIAVGDNLNAVSTDGITWINYSGLPFGTINNLSSIVFGQDKFLVGNIVGGVMSSTDGIFWSTVNTGGAASPVKLAISQSLYAAATTSAVRLSTDLITWTTTNNPTNNNILGIGGGNSGIIFGVTAATTGIINEFYSEQAYLTLSTYGDTILQS